MNLIESINNIEAEQEADVHADEYADESLFNISSWGADLSFRELITMYEEGELLKPELQRQYVWDKTTASRFIESILMGLPVPSIFLAKQGENRLIVDGYQRIMTVHDYVKGKFADETVFRLSNTNKINERWRKKAFVEITPDEQKKIKSTTIHAIVFEQKHPQGDDTSLFQIFERINAAGKTLTPQEIRNCVYQGSFNTLLFSLNENVKWRKLFGMKKPDARMRDLEYILRFFLMKSREIHELTAVQISLKKFLNLFMQEHKDDSQESIMQFAHDFQSMVETVYDNFGECAFQNYISGAYTGRFHPAIFDAVSVATHREISKTGKFDITLREKHKELLCDKKFIKSISEDTRTKQSIMDRINRAYSVLFANGTF